MFGRKKDGLLAIDFAPDAVRVLEVAFRGDAPAVLGAASAALPDGPPDTLPDRHVRALDGVLAAHRFRSRRCVATVPTTLVVTRSVTIDAGKPAPVEDQIRQTLQNCVPGDARDLVFDFWPVGGKPGEAPPRVHDVLVVATAAGVIGRYLDGLTRLKLACEHLDVAPCALATLIARLAPLHGRQDGPVGAITLTDTLGYFAVVDPAGPAGRVLFWRPFELAAGKGPAAPAGAPAGLARLGDEISKCVSHMVGSLHLDGMTDIYAFGRGTQDEAFAAYLAGRFHVQVRTPSPFDAFAGDARAGGVDVAAGVGPAALTDFATAFGLAFQAPAAAGAVHG
jgi:hypothetical protein